MKTEKIICLKLKKEWKLNSFFLLILSVRIRSQAVKINVGVALGKLLIAVKRKILSKGRMDDDKRD